MRLKRLLNSGEQEVSWASEILNATQMNSFDNFNSTSLINFDKGFNQLLLCIIILLLLLSKAKKTYVLKIFDRLLIIKFYVHEPYFDQNIFFFGFFHKKFSMFKHC